MDQGMKRKAESNPSGSRDKRTKTKKQWRVSRKNEGTLLQAKAIQPGDSGIWATCNKGHEGKCIGELRDLFDEYAELLYGDSLPGAPNGDDEPDDAELPVDIESQINAELSETHRPTTVQMFTPIRIDVQCVVFFKTVAPVEPVSFVKRICEDAMSDSSRKRTRFAMRLSPMTLMGRPSTEGLEKVAREVLTPHFHQEPRQTRKFAIRPTLRNHNTLTRDTVIRQVASLVGPGHQVDLKNYDLLIIVEIYQNICGMSVLDNSFERLKRYNLAEIFDPTPKEIVGNAREVLAPPIPAEESALKCAPTASIGSMDVTKDAVAVPDSIGSRGAADTG